MWLHQQQRLTTRVREDGDIQTWTVPATGVYKIEAWGAAGGAGSLVHKIQIRAMAMGQSYLVNLL